MHAPPIATSYRDHHAVCTRRADAALERGGFDHLVIPSGTLHYHLFDDRDYPYAVNPQFKAWLPLTDTPGSWLSYTPGQRPRLVFLQPHDYWHAVPEDPSGPWVEHFDIITIREPDEARRHLPDAPGRCAILGDPASALGDYVPNNPVAVLDYLDFYRAFKTPYEIHMLRRANSIAARAHRAAERGFRAGASEFGIHLAYCMAAG
ncbi:MAG: Xaa-Pro dipeptidase, partial [Pseudoxanthomonas suwonensis]|nr:Xaa-Pro dipeptidase [Pseudoxanthomonas suwonensis]